MTTQEKSEQFAAEYAKVQQSLFAYILTLVPHLSDAQDVLQETNLALWAKREQYDPARPFWPWACRFAQTQVLAFLKRHKSDRLRFNPDLANLLVREIEEEQARENPNSSALDHCLKLLPPSSAELLKQRHGEGLSVERIAQRAGRSAEAVKSLLYRARQALVQCMRRTLAAWERH
jgi:RNA polymerase sigma-70 factor (ECF subfamily)